MTRSKELKLHPGRLRLDLRKNILTPEVGQHCDKSWGVTNLALEVCMFRSDKYLAGLI